MLGAAIDDLHRPLETLDLESEKTMARAFETPGDVNVRGRFDFVVTFATRNLNREIWISQCPGGEAVSEDGYCRASGTETVSVGWRLENIRWDCTLETHSEYYINFKLEDCPGESCGSYFNSELR